MSLVERVEREIAELLQRLDGVYRLTPEARRAAASWTVSERRLSWQVLLEEVEEPDVDVEIAREAIVVRARTADDSLQIRLLPVPSEFDPDHPAIRFESGLLEVVLVRRPEART